ncbi:MAG TPA: ribosome biogenesis factor YjgA [Gammaproteobacteria bacterium]|nr:ribosome biogenesis factor YjgA [Gammaproteobacteria bacterium]
MYEDEDERPSRSARKREADEIHALGERLATLPDSTLEQLALSAELLDALRLVRRLSNQRGAQRRQKLFVAKLLRNHDVDNIRSLLAAQDRAAETERREFHEIERWRDRLLEEGMPALEEFFTRYPRADRQRLRQLLTAAARERAQGQPPRRQRELFRELRAGMQDEG